jgi:hypothetical protein
MTQVAEKIDTPTMDERISQLLKEPAGASAETIALHLRWAKASATVAENAGRAARLKSVDPQCVDGIAERSKAEDHEFIAQRLRNAVEALELLLQAATRREELAQWKARTAGLQQRVADLSQELLGVYAETTAKLVDLFSRCDAADKAVAQINYAAPDTLHRLCGVEATLTKGSDTKIIPRVKLPTLTSNGHAAPDAWPPVAIPIGVQLHDAMIAGMRMARPPTEDERIAESMRVVAFYDQQEAGRIKLNEAAEARAREQRSAAAGG